jgi:hypothetical protein
MARIGEVDPLIGERNRFGGEERRKGTNNVVNGTSERFQMSLQKCAPHNWG